MSMLRISNPNEIDDFERRLSSLSPEGLLESYLRGISQKSDALDMVNPLLRETTVALLEEAVFSVQKTKYLLLQKYKKTAPAEIISLYYTIEIPIRRYEGAHHIPEYMEEYFEPDPNFKFPETDESLSNAYVDRDFLDNLILELRGNWKEIIENNRVNSLFYYYNIFDNLDQEEINQAK